MSRIVDHFAVMSPEEIGRAYCDDPDGFEFACSAAGYYDGSKEYDDAFIAAGQALTERSNHA